MASGLIAIAVFLSALSIDFASARYVRAVEELAASRAARWSAVQWASGIVGFIVAVKVTLWMLPVEVAGLYVGTLVSVRRLRRLALVPATAHLPSSQPAVALVPRTSD